MKFKIASLFCLTSAMTAQGAILAGFYAFQTNDTQDPPVTQNADEGALLATSTITYNRGLNNFGSNDGVYGNNGPTGPGDNLDNGYAVINTGVTITVANTGSDSYPLGNFFFDIRNSLTPSSPIPFEVEVKLEGVTIASSSGNVSFSTGLVFGDYNVLLYGNTLGAGETVEVLITNPDVVCCDFLRVDNMALATETVQVIPEPSGAFSVAALCMAGLFFRQRRRAA